MHRPASCRRFRAWIILALWLCATLAPGVSRAMAFVQDQIAPWSTVCAAEGGDARQPGEVLKHLADHCPACTLQGDHLAPPGPPACAMHPVGLRGLVPRLLLQSPRPLANWAPAQARAPPTGA